MNDLEADSLDLVELHMALEDATGAKIPDDEIAKLQTVNDVLTYIKGNAA
jgi:acyl carrier protein